MVKNLPHLCAKHSEKLSELEVSGSPERDLLVGGLIVEAEACPECNPTERLHEAPWLRHSSEDTPDMPSHAKGECADCLYWSWIFAFLKALNQVTSSSAQEHLRGRARLKASFPGHPKERTPRGDCFSTEEFLLVAGQRFSVEALTREEEVLVRSAHEALKHAAGGQIPSGKSWESNGWATISDEAGELIDIPLPPEEHVDPWSDFAVAQLAWEATRGKLSYVEGVALRQAEPDPLPRDTAWSAVNGKVVLVRSCEPGSPKTEYFGVILDEEIRQASSNPVFARYSRLLPFSADGVLHG